MFLATFIIFLQQKLQQHMKLHDPKETEQKKVRSEFNFRTRFIYGFVHLGPFHTWNMQIIFLYLNYV